MSVSTSEKNGFEEEIRAMCVCVCVSARVEWGVTKIPLWVRATTSLQNS